MKAGLFVATIVLWLISIGTARRARHLQQSAPPQAAQEAQRSRYRWLKVASLAAAWVLGVATLIQTADVVMGPFWPMRPVFEPILVGASSAMDIPFKVYNPSLYTYNHVTISCHVDDLELAGDDHFHVGLQVIGQDATVPPGDSGTYRCPFNTMIQMFPQPPILRAQMTFTMVIHRPWWFWERREDSFSTTFTLDPLTSPPTWHAGATY